MPNKFLVTIILPTIEMEYDIYIPNNKKVGTIKKYVLEVVKELSDNSYNKTFENIRFIDRENGKEYLNDAFIKDTGIKNGAKIVII